MTTLHITGVESAVQLVLKTGKVSADSKDSNGRTPLSWAAEHGHGHVVQLLLDTGEVAADSKDTEYGRTPLSYAAANGHDEVVQLLLNSGQVEPDSVDSGQSLRSDAVVMGCKEWP
jgi:ankyrin repeat protein